MTDEDGRWITPKEAAEKLGVSTRTVARIADTGPIHFIKLPSGHHRYDVNDVERLATEQTAAVSAEE